MIKNESNFSVFSVNINPPQFLEKALDGPAKEIEVTLTNIFQSVFSPANEWAAKVLSHNKPHINEYASSISDEINQIPADKLTPPSMSIVGSACYASQHRIDCKEIRNMFAKLIAASMNSDTQAYAHEGMVDIIKQLSPLDAHHLDCLKSGDYKQIVHYIAYLKNGGIRILIKNVFLENPKFQDPTLNSISITNLERLGLVSIVDQSLTNRKYTHYETSDLYTKYCNTLKSIQANDTLIINETDLAKEWFIGVDSIAIEKHAVALTSLGKALATLCC